MRALVLLASIVALAACRAQPPTPTCNVHALTELGNELVSMSIVDRADRVWPGIVAACESIPWTLNEYFDPELASDVLTSHRDTRIVALQNVACPGWEALRRAVAESGIGFSADALFERCNFARYQVFDADEIAGHASAIMTWTTHQWLLDRGVDPQVAAPLTRALFAREQIMWWMIDRDDQLRWPRAHGVPFVGPGPAIHVRREQIMFAAKPYTLDDGVLEADTVMWLADALAQEAARQEALLIVADIGTPMVTIMRLIRMARSAGFHSQGVFVEPANGYLPTSIPMQIAPEEPAPDPAQIPMMMTVELEPEGLTLGRGWGDRQSIEAHSIRDLEAVARFAAEIRRRDPAARKAVVSAADTVTLEQALAVIEAARGAECSETGEGCLLPEILLRNEDAHLWPRRQSP